jgi:Pyruvate/2-oxoacid:ferredoxin oxidoreductase delta subunit
MSQEVYKKLFENIRKRGGHVYELPEFYAILEALFTPEEAALASLQPPGSSLTAGELAPKMEVTEEQIRPLLDTMVEKGTCTFSDSDGIRHFGAPSIDLMRNLQFVRLIPTGREKLLAQLFGQFYKAWEAKTGPLKYPLPIFRVISIEKTIPVDNVIHTYDQVSYYIEKADPIAVSACYCRQQAKLADPDYYCKAPLESCLYFNQNAEFIIAANFGRKITKQEAYAILEASEEAGLIHTGAYNQDINDICNCCTCHCGRIVPGMKQTQSIIGRYSGFQPQMDAEICISCRSGRTCLEQCPMKALSLDGTQTVVVNMDLCIGCGLCVRHCQDQAIRMVGKPDFPVPPANWEAFVAEMAEARKKMMTQEPRTPK